MNSGNKKAVSMETLLYAEINLICIAVMTVIAIKSMRLDYVSMAKRKVFVASVWCSVGANVCDFLWKTANTSYTHASLGYLQMVNFCYFMLFALSSYLWFLYTEMEQKDTLLKSRKSYVICAIPLMLLFGLLILSLFNGCLFWFDDEMNYHRGPVFFLQQILAFCFLVFASARSLMRAVSKSYFARRKELTVMAMFIVPPTICTVLQTLEQNLPTLSVGVMISFLLVFVDSMEGYISRDPLTDIINRRELLKRLSAAMEGQKEKEEIYFFFFDVDNFKRINDTYGHGEGDRILKEVSKVLRNYARKSHGYAGRYGGDEFAMFLIHDAEEPEIDYRTEIEGDIEESGIRLMDGTPVHISIGFTRYRGESDNIEDLIGRADEKMYNVKRGKKKTP